VAWRADLTTQLHSQQHARPKEQQPWHGFHSGDGECLQQKPERCKVQAEQLYGFPVLHLSPADMPEATEDLTDCSWLPTSDLILGDHRMRSGFGDHGMECIAKCAVS